jgi:Ca-activated chloride channel family protein
MRFATPWALALLFLIPLFFYYWLHSAKAPFVRIHFQSRKKPRRFFDPALVTTALKALAFACLVIALARPQGISRSQERKANGIDIIMVLDVSLSMLIQDMGEKNRMEIAKDTFKQFIEGRSSDRIGFVIFSGEPLTLAPPTLDYGLLFAQLQTVEPGGQGLRDGTAIGDGLALAVNRLKKSTARSKVIILLTDGDNNVGRIDPMTAGELALGYGIRVYSVAIGTEGRVQQPFPQQTPLGVTYTKVWVENKLNPGLLKEISAKTNGQFWRVQDQKTLREVFQSIDKLEKNDVTTQDKVHYNEDFIPYLIIAVCALILERLLSVVIWRQWA